jgi:hypothetical protein
LDCIRKGMHSKSWCGHAILNGHLVRQRTCEITRLKRKRGYEDGRHIELVQAHTQKIDLQSVTRDMIHLSPIEVRMF